MTQRATPFPVPETIPPTLRRVLAYWQSLKRGNADMPFWDDATLTAMPDLAHQLILIDVFARPERFRLDHVGDACRALHRDKIVGRFLDEIDPEPPFEFLQSQCSATVENKAPTLYVHETKSKPSPERAYSRLLLPMWGDGRIGMILGGIDWR